MCPRSHDGSRVFVLSSTQVADLKVNLYTHEVRRSARLITLTSKEFALLECFVQHEGCVLDRATIIARVSSALIILPMSSGARYSAPASVL